MRYYKKWQVRVFQNAKTCYYILRLVQIYVIIIQQIVTMPIYGKEARNICHPYMTDILRYT